MMPTLRKLAGLILLLVLLSSTYSCKSKKKAMEAAAAEKARIEREQAEKDKQAAELAKQQAAAAEKARLEAEEKLRRENELKAASSPTNKLNQYFSSIANAGNTTAANASISEALTMFASPSTPVLIVISEEGGVKDYDRPTTIKDYLNYLKDQKKSANAISDIKTDSSGKITELELRKK